MADESRLTTIERDLATLTIQVEHLTENVRTLVDFYRTELRTPWGVIFTGFSVTLSVVTVIGWLVITPINDSLDRINKRIDEDVEPLVLNHTQDGHPNLIRQLVLANRDRIEDEQTEVQALRETVNTIQAISARMEARLEILENRP